MKLRAFAVAVVCLAAIAVGCSSQSPCQDLIDAVNSASKLKDCGGDTLKMYTDGLDPNCAPSDTQAKIIEAEAACFGQLKSCDAAETMSLMACVSRAQAQ